MPVCAFQTADGIQLQQMASAADACTGVVLLQASDVPPNPFVLTDAQGLAIGGAVGTVWLIAWGCKAAVMALRSGGD